MLGRRGLIAGAAAVGASLALAEPGGARRILVLGGSRFVGLHFVAAALARGHHVTLFNRGRTAPGVFPAAEELVGDRHGDLAALRGRSWDVVLDTWGRQAGPVRVSCASLEPSVANYVYISSASVYADNGPAPYTEATRVHEIRPDSYAGDKLAGEAAVREAFVERATIVRPTVIVGPHDPRDRFVRWPLRAREGGELLVPGAPADTLPLIDARDLAAWLVHVVEARVTGTFNVGSLPTLGALISACVARAGAPVQPVWVDAAWACEQALDFNTVPPLRANGYRGYSSARARAHGLQTRDLERTLDDTLRWWDAQPGSRALTDQIRDREPELLRLWRARTSTHAL